MKENRTTTCYVTTLYFFKHPIENYFLFHDELGKYAYLCYALFRGSATVGMVPTPSGRPSKKKRKRSLEDARMCAIWRRRRRKLPPSDLVFPSKVRKRRGGNPTADNPFHRQTGWERKRKRGRDRRILSASVSGKSKGGDDISCFLPPVPNKCLSE